MSDNLPAVSHHSELGASKSYRWLNCPGSVALTREMDSKRGPEAQLGTNAHSVGELCLRNGDDPMDFIGHGLITQESGGEMFSVDRDMALAVKVYVDEVRRIKESAPDDAFMLIEHQFDLAHLGHPEMFGRNDVCIGVLFGDLWVIDYKHGAGIPVEAAGNPQLRYYGLGALPLGNFENIHNMVIQPRCEHRDGPIRCETMPVEELEAWGQDVLLRGAEATKEPNAPLCTGEWCQKTFCPARPTCPAYYDLTVSVAAEAFALPKPEMLSPAKLREILEKAPLIKSFLESVTNYARTALEDGRISSEDLGHKLVHGRASRSWTDEKAAEEVLESLLGDEAFTPRKLLSPNKAEKLLGGAAAKDLVASMVTKTRGVSMVPNGDKRKAINPPAALAFDAFNEGSEE